MATKVTRKIYKQIKTEIDTSMKLGIIPTHKDKKRSKKRLKQYNRIARYYNLSINTIRGIGKSKGYADYHRIMQGYKLRQPKTRFTHTNPEKPITITLPTPTVESRDLNVKETPSKPKRGRPTEIKRDITKTSQSGLREGLTRATFIIREDTLDKLKERAYTDRKKLKDLVTEALDYYLDNYVERLRRDLYTAINEISDLQSEMAIIKAKKGRWFKNGQTTSKK